ncbi:hypothetical protein MLD38_028736 [Melastoma candidum]|uniref:Uncharacterized protein n=1 Tax=Melastoma candidum TaxID=119954 RepID=A0ACB9N3H2_9MYRT|nr:hypothetical protein MLD38_028736 [Melastoma candidum]
MERSHWQNLQVGWDESTTGERSSRVSIWEIEHVITPFYICPPPFFRPKFPQQPGALAQNEMGVKNPFKRAMPWMGDEFGMTDTTSSIFPGLSLVQWMSMQKKNPLQAAAQSAMLPQILSMASLPSNFTVKEIHIEFQIPSVTRSENTY